MNLLILFLLTVQSVPCSIAQDYSIPSEWLNTTSFLSRNEKVGLAQNVLDGITMYNSSTGTIDSVLGLQIGLRSDENAELFTATVIHDSLVPNKSNYNAAKDRLSKVMHKLSQQSSESLSSDDLLWGIAAIHAFKTYQDHSFVDNAIAVWELYRALLIGDPSGGPNPSLRDITVRTMQSCNGNSNAGGTMLSLSKSDIEFDVSAKGTGSYMGLSAYLFDITNNQTYHDAAQLSMTFIQSQLYDAVTTKYVNPIFDPNYCQLKPDNKRNSFDSGLYLEALSVFAYRTNNDTLIQQANQLALNAMKFSPWNSPNGVVHEDPLDPWNPEYKAPLRGILMRALSEHRSRNPADSQISRLIKAFLLIQHNNLKNNIQIPDSSNYLPNWGNPSVPSTLSVQSQVDALDVLNFAIDLEDDTPSSSGSTPTPTLASVTSPLHPLPLGPIIGGSVGGAVFVIIVLIVAFFLFRRWKVRSTHGGAHYAQTASMVNASDEQMRVVEHHFVEPFTLPLSAADLLHPSKQQNEVHHASTRIMPLLPQASHGTQDIEPSPVNGAYSITNHSVPSNAPPDYQTIA